MGWVLLSGRLRGSIAARGLFAAALLLLPGSIAWCEPAAPGAAEMLYRHGVLPSGEPLRGERESATPVLGATAACVNCHRRSGLGTTEGRIFIPPITGKYLFNRGTQTPAEIELPPDVAAPDRREYTEATLARAIREGTGSDGRALSYLMPRFKLDDDTMASLIAYLKGLSGGRVPGVTEDTLEFATIVTPDADPMQRQGMLDVLNNFFEIKDAYYRGKSPPLQSSRNINFRVARKWELHVWELSGEPETWEEQLRQHLHAQPVFAVISGLGGRTWAPIHSFCEHESVPCLLPNVDLPVVAEDDFYPVYFSRGVLLEAQLIAQRLAQEPARAAPHRVVQVFREGDIGVPAAEAVRAAMGQGDLQIVNRALKAGGGDRALVNALKDTGPGDAIVLWLRPADLSHLPKEPAANSIVLVSGLMAGLENAPLPAPWRRVVRMSYPFELPDLRRVRMNYPLGWFTVRQIPVVAERTQTDTFLACNILAEVLGHMQNNFVRDYLVERVETMLSARLINGYYPRLGLAPGQRFASKGGYIVRFAEPTGTRLVGDSEWIVP